ncbi:MAG: hypothetical protein J6K44_03820 [Clostridia bacterium]|nr:hypothetical protein [Clostridia bacterium]MBP3583150.1 hypothetical protein [Clostridia bacterium]
MSIFENKVFVESIPMWLPANALKGTPVGSYKIASKIGLEKGNIYSGTSYADMLNKALLTSIQEGYIKSGYPMDMVGLGDALAWFAYFDGVLRKSGKDGEYCNTFISKDEILETCVIDDINEYRKNARLADQYDLFLSEKASSLVNSRGYFIRNPSMFIKRTMH